MFDIWVRVFRRGREAITAALDRFDAAQGQIAALPFDILTAPEALTVKNRLETISRARPPSITGDSSAHLSRQPIELGGKSCTDMLCTRLRIGCTATRRRRSGCTQTTGRQSNSPVDVGGRIPRFAVRCAAQNALEPCRYGYECADSGVAHTLVSGVVGLNTDSQGVQIAWSETSNADDWSKNLIRVRCEGRYATSIFQPLGVVQSDLTA